MSAICIYYYIIGVVQCQISLFQKKNRKIQITITFVLKSVRFTGVHEGHGSFLQIYIRPDQTEFRIFYLCHTHSRRTNHHPVSVVLKPVRFQLPFLRFICSARLYRENENPRHVQIHCIVPVQFDKNEIES